MRHFLPILLAAVALATASCRAKPDLAPAPITYRSEQFPYSIAYDLNRWRILAPKERDVVMAQGDLVLADVGARHFLAVLAERTPLTITEMRTRALIAMQQRGPDLQVISQNPVTVAGAPALRVQLQATMREQPLAFDLVFVPYGGVAYQLVYWSVADEFMVRSRDFSDFVASFRPRAAAGNKPEGLVAYPSPAAGYIVTLPYPEWKISPEKLSSDADQQFQTQSALAFMMVIRENLPISLDSFVERGVARMRQASNNQFRATGSENMTIDGIAGRVVFGETDVQGSRFGYAILFTVVNGTAYQVAAWAPADLFHERYKKQFLDIFRTVQFLS